MSENNTKYSVPEGHWDDHPFDRVDTDDDGNEITSIDSHEVAVIHTTDPHEKNGYGRDRYVAHVGYNDRSPYVVYFTQYRWKGNFWRKSKDVDWQDVPGVVRHKVAEVLPVDTRDDIDPGMRLVDEDGWEWKSGSEEET